MKRIAIMQPYSFPYVGYYQLMSAVDQFVFLDDVNYINKGWINRNQIVNGGRPQLFTLPLKDASQNKKINEIELTRDGKVEAKFMRTIESAYSRSVNFKAGMQLLNSVFESDKNNLSHFILSSFESFFHWLKIDIQLYKSSEVDPNPSFHAEDRILHLCKELGATHYLNPPGGKTLYNPASFAAKGVSLEFIAPVISQYPQKSPTFLPGMSMIDIMMNTSPEWINETIRNNKIDIA